QVLDVLRGDVLAAGRDDDVLLAIGDRQEAALVDLAHVAGMEPAVAREDGPGRLFVLVVAGEYRLPLDQDLTVVRDRDVDPGERGADRAELEVARAVDVRRGRAFGLPVALENQGVQRVEELGDLLRQRRAARDRAAQ